MKFVDATSAANCQRALDRPNSEQFEDFAKGKMKRSLEILGFFQFFAFRFLQFGR